MGERRAAINQFNELCRQRNGAIEQDFYAAVKSVWGAQCGRRHASDVVALPGSARVQEERTGLVDRQAGLGANG